MKETKADLDPDLVEKLKTCDSQMARIELLLIQIIRILKKK